MASFLRVVKSCLRYRLTVVATVVCALAIGLLWGANIGTVFPFVEVVFGGKSLPDWVDAEIAQAEQRIEKLNDELERLQAVSSDSSEGLVVARRHAEQVALASYRRLQPWIHQYTPRTPFATLVLVVGVLLLGTFFKACLLAVSTVLTERLAQVGSVHLRKRAYHQTLQLPVNELQQAGSSQLTSRLTFDLEQVTVGLRVIFGRFIREPLKMLACLAGAAWVCWRLLLVSLLVAPIFVWLISRLNRSVKKANAHALDDMSRIHRVVAETLRAMKQIRAFTVERLMRSKFDDASRAYVQRAMRVSYLDALIRPSIELMTVGIVGVAVLAGGYLVLNEQTHLMGIRISDRPLSISSLLLFFGLLTGVSDPARKLSGVINRLQRAAAAADRIDMLFEPQDSGVSSSLSTTDSPVLVRETGCHKSEAAILGKIQFRNVGFAYQAGSPVLEDVTFTIAENETVAVVGPNGCGKSTLMQLLLRFHEPSNGQILIDGVPLQQFHSRWLRRQIGLVTQDSVMLDDTVEQNIWMGKRRATRQQVIAAARKAHAHDFIQNQLPLGYNTAVGESGSQLSGGQRQRLAVARAILREPRILLLDEATSQVDLESERQIHDTLRSFSKNRTTIIITHQLSALALADRILVMDQGRVVDSGDYQSLLARCEPFQRLANSGLKRSA